MAKDVSELKAVSQNLLHENLSVTDGVYGVLSDVDVRTKIIKMGQGLDVKKGEELIVLIKGLLLKMAAR